MNVEKFNAIVRKLRLTPTRVPRVFLNEQKQTQYVRDPSDLTEPEIRALAKKLIEARGREISEFDLD
jgi:hypothetical protein